MKHLKMLGLAAIAALGLLAFVGAGTASATTLCSTNTNPCTGTSYGVGTKIHADSEGHVVLKAAFAEALCNSTVEGEVTNAGGHPGTVSGPITHLTFFNCTSPCTAAVATKNANGNYGTLEVHTQNATSNGNGTLTAFNALVHVTCSGVTCDFGTAEAGTDLGTLTGGNPHATLDINATVVYKGGAGSFVCAGFSGTANWSGNYTVTKPTPLFVI